MLNGVKGITLDIGADAPKPAPGSNPKEQTREAQILLDLEVAPETGLSIEYAKQLMSVGAQLIQFAGHGTQQRLNYLIDDIESIPTYSEYLENRTAQEERSEHRDRLLKIREELSQDIQVIDQAVEELKDQILPKFQNPSTDVKVNREAAGELIAWTNRVARAVCGVEGAERRLGQLADTEDVSQVKEKISANLRTLAIRKINARSQPPETPSVEE